MIPVFGPFIWLSSTGGLLVGIWLSARAAPVAMPFGRLLATAASASAAGWAAQALVCVLDLSSGPRIGALALQAYVAAAGCTVFALSRWIFRDESTVSARLAVMAMVYGIGVLLLGFLCWYALAFTLFIPRGPAGPR